MIFGTVYYTTRSPRSNWIVDLGRYVNLEITGVCVDDPETCPEFIKRFPLRKNPSFIGSDEMELTETVSIFRYIISKSEKPHFFGASVEERASCLSWLSFFNSEFMDAARDLVFHKTGDLRISSMSKIGLLLDYLNERLRTGNKEYLCCDSILVADIFAFKLINIVASHGSDLSNLAYLSAYMGNVSFHPLITKIMEPTPLFQHRSLMIL